MFQRAEDMDMYMKLDISPLAFGIAAMLIAVGSRAAVPEGVFAEPYQPVAAVGMGQSQVVYYHADRQGGASPVSHVYVDGEFHTGLVPGGFTVFCVKEGSHSLGAVQGDAPRYEGKRSQGTFRFEGGQTYFVRTGSGSSSAPEVVSREDAEIQLAASKQQVHLVSRASTVVPCSLELVGGRDEFTLAGDVLFPLGKAGYDDVRSEGRQIVADVAKQLRMDGVTPLQIVVVGHADPTGQAVSNDILGLRRAATVRDLLVENGVAPAVIAISSKGHREPVVRNCAGSQEEVVRCNAPNRRVVIEVRGRR